MIVNSAYMYMGKALPKSIHLFSNGAPNYNFAALTPGSQIDNTGLVMKEYSLCKFSGVPLQDKTKITVNFTNRSYPQSSRFVLYIKTSDMQSKFSVAKSTKNPSEIFEIAIPERAQFENATIQLEAASGNCTFTDITIE